MKICLRDADLEVNIILTYFECLLYPRLWMGGDRVKIIVSEIWGDDFSEGLDKENLKGLSRNIPLLVERYEVR